MILATLILQSLITDSEYSRAVIPYIKAEYFEKESEQVFFSKIAEYTEKYLTPPTLDAVIIEIADDTKINENTAKGIDDLIEDLRKPYEKPSSLKWLVDKTEEFCKHRAVFNGVKASVKLMTSGEAGKILDVFKEALSISFDQKLGHDYIANAEDRWQYYHRVENKIPFRMEWFNKITGNGIARKTLTLIYAGTHVGKSAHMCSLAADNILNGNNVLYITNEMSEEETAMRIDAKLMDTDIPYIKTMDKEIFGKKIAALQRKSLGKLKIKEYPTATAHVGHFRALLDDLQLKQGFIPDVIYVDYLNICASQRLKMGANVNSYTYMKVIAEELRGLAVERDVAIVTASQFNRSASTSSDPGMDDVSESFGISFTGDLIYALVASDDLTKRGLILVKQLKNRYSDKGRFPKFLIGFDRLKMNFKDAEGANDNDGEIPDLPIVDKKESTGGKDFSQFKF